MSDRDPMVRLLHMRDYAAKIGTLIAERIKQSSNKMKCSALL